MKRRNFLKTLILAPFVKLLPKDKLNKEILEIPDNAFSDWTFTCNSYDGSSSTIDISLYMLNSEGEWQRVKDK